MLPTNPEMDDNLAESKQKLPWLSIAAEFHVILLAAIVLAMTAITHNLDDIKVLLFYIAGPILMLMGLSLAVTGQAPAPNKLIAAGLLSYGAVLLISTMVSDYAYAGWDQCLFQWAAFGFFISAMAIGSSRKPGETLMRGLVVMLLITNLVGFFMFNLTGGGHSGVEWLYQKLYGEIAFTHPPSLYRLLRTLKGAQSDMQSTILSRDFYASFCVFILPFAMLLAVEPGRSQFRKAWRVLGLIASATATATVVLCSSKFQLFALALCPILFSALFMPTRSEGEDGEDRRAWLAGLVVLMFVTAAAMAFLSFPRILAYLKYPYISWNALSIMWPGALMNFVHNPILGTGPGTFAIYFPLYRDPSYFSNGISHVTTFSHNHFLDVMSDTGALGLIAFVVLLAGIVAPLVRAFRHPDALLRSRIVAGLIAFVVIICSIMAGPFSRWPVGAITMWSVFGLIAGWGMQATASEETMSRPIKWGLAALALAAVMMLPVSVMHGKHYWNSAVSYAQGVGCMEPGMNALEKGDMEDTEALLLESAGYFEAAIAREPHSLSPYYKLGSVWTTLNALEASKTNATGSGKKSAEAERHRALSDRYLVKAKDAYESLSALNPNYAQIHYNLGIVYDLYGDVLRRLAEGSPRRDALGREADRYGVMSMDRFAYNIKMSDTKESAYGYIHSLMKHKRYVDALRVAQKWSDREPGDADLAGLYCLAAQETGNQQAIDRAAERVKKIAR
ncbi:MAG: O-antigen ligase family protein [Candidatus Sumerlaeia bacterium]